MEKRDFSEFLLKFLNRRSAKYLRISQKLVKNIYQVLSQYVLTLKVDGYCIYDTKTLELVKIKNLKGYIQVIKDLKKTILEKDGEMFFRGQRYFGWSLAPSLYRDSSWVKNENIMIEEMIRQYPEFLDDKKRIDTLTKLQHYDFPTRLLDITENPLVALFFACSDKDLSTDGCIFYFNPDPKQIKYSNSDSVTVLANISKMNYEFGENNFKENQDRFLWFLQDEKPNFRILEDTKILNQCFYVKAHFNNKRIRSQEGAFILVGVGKDNKEMANIEFETDKCKKIIMVDRSRKIDILEELSQFGVNEGVIYPEISKESVYISSKYKTHEK